MTRGVATGGVTRAEAVAGSLRESILSGRFLSGERLIEIKLAQKFEVSQNTVRDALRILEQEGWVVKTPRYGVHVRAISAADAAEVCALIAGVEALALTWAMEQNHKALRAELAPLVAAARKSAYGGDRPQAFEQLLSFHHHIGAASGKPLTEQLLDTLYNQIRLLEALRRARAPRSARELGALIDAHETLLRLIDAGNADAACQFLREQVAEYNGAIVAALRL
jgi:DNA-binding GntR family transcriptional regulator